MYMNLKKCPACGIKVLSQGIKNHISGKAEAEAFNALVGILKYNKNGKVCFSSIVCKRLNKHLSLYLKNAKEMTDGSLSLKYFKVK